MTHTDDLAALTYEELVEKLEDLTRRIASGEVGIEEASELYERAGAIHRLAAERLAQVRARIERLDGTSRD
ncbi:MAG TPA: exodeoxyribonuclease VII small subunit [Acidimicrobiales bacterium]|nr:exodeoxyribonuclease VII small subunit [Acidimicrobiales bacterium]